MEHNHFDRLTRTLAATDSRRGAVKTLAAAGLGLGLLKAQGGEAQKKRKKRCKRLLQTCNPEGKRKCCQDRVCNSRGDGFKCRQGPNEPCTSSDECRSLLVCLSGKCGVPNIPLP